MKPLKIFFDSSAGATLRAVLTHHSELFAETELMTADVVIFGSDEITYLKNNDIYKNFQSRSMCITETDTPTFRLPGLYAANEVSLLAGPRTRTISYFISERDRPNPEIAKHLNAQTEKSYLYSFMGGSNSWTRKRLFRLLTSKADTLIEKTSSYNHWTDHPDDIAERQRQRQRYAQVMATSKFILCPRGCGLSSYRLFESMSLGIAPVIISDKWRPIEGIDWNFAIFVKERHLAKIDQIIRSHEPEWDARGQAASFAYNTVLRPDVVATMLHRHISELAASYNPKHEAIVALAAPARVRMIQGYWRALQLLKMIAFKVCYTSGISFPLALNQPLEQQLLRSRLIGGRTNSG